MERTKRGDAIAIQIAKRLASVPRGAFAWGEDLVVFGNDGYEVDPWARHQVEYVAAWAEGTWLRVRAFGVNESGFTWAVVLRPRRGAGDLQWLAREATGVVWDAWEDAQVPPWKRDGSRGAQPATGPEEEDA